MMRQERGFTLVELMVATTVTLIVSAAIYGLLTSGANAFRREPELADRQQNIRVAMDLLSRDVYNAGASLPTFAQVFTRVDSTGGACTDDTTGLNGCGPEGTLGAGAAANRGKADSGGDSSTNTDVLEVVSTDESCPPVRTCQADAGYVISTAKLPACLGLPRLLVVTENSPNPEELAFTVRPGSLGSRSAGCPSGTNAAENPQIELGETLPGFAAANPIDTLPLYVYGARIVRYRVAPTAAADATPALWRSTTGRFAADGAASTEPGAAGFVAAGSPWEVVARGIEDVQLEFQAGADPSVWTNRPPLADGSWNTLVRQVRITLSARASEPNLQGQTRPGGAGPNAVRGQLTTVVAPRAALNELQMGGEIK